VELRFRRSVTRIYKLWFRRKKTQYTYTMEYTWKVGLSGFGCSGDVPFEGKVITRLWE
jgi:hypothetical protein